VLTNLIRPAARAGHLEFDAGEKLLVDQANSIDPSRSWSTSSLLSQLEKVIRARAFSAGGELSLKRSIHGTSILAFLSDRGLDPHDLVRYAYGRQLRLTLDAELARFASERRTPVGGLSPWHAYRNEVTADSENELSLSEPFRARVRAWMDIASPEALINWSAPDRQTWDQLPEPRPRDKEEDEYQWFVERLSTTYLDSWSDVALEFEYEFLNSGLRPSTIPNELGLERRIDQAVVNAELARRHVKGSRLDVQALGALTDRAREAIEEGDAAVASVIFRSALTLNPHDQLLTNNLGFSLIPNDPSAALATLAEARALGPGAVLIEANTAAAHYCLGNFDDALTACDRAREVGLATGAEGWFWRLPMPSTPALESAKAGIYICEIAILCADALGRGGVASEWKTLRNALGTKG